MKNLIKICLLSLISFSAFSQKGINVVVTNPKTANSILDAVEINFPKESATISTYTNASVPSDGTDIVPSGRISKTGGFEPFVRDFIFHSNVSGKLVIQIKPFGAISANAIGLFIEPVTLKAGDVTRVPINGQFAWRCQFIVKFYSNGSTVPGAVTITFGYDGFDAFNAFNTYAPYAFLGIGDSIMRSGNSTLTTNHALSWWAGTFEYLNSKYKYQLFPLNRAVPSITAELMLEEIRKGWLKTDRNVVEIVIELGTNLSASDAVYTSSMTAIIQECLARFPNARIIVYGPPKRADASETTLEGYRVILQNLVNSLNLSKVVYDDFGTLGVLSGVTSSDPHPDDSGHSLMKNKVVSKYTSLGFN